MRRNVVSDHFGNPGSFLRHGSLGKHAQAISLTRSPRGEFKKGITHIKSNNILELLLSAKKVYVCLHTNFIQ